jgi:hypothetical protein
MCEAVSVLGMCSLRWLKPYGGHSVPTRLRAYAFRVCGDMSLVMESVARIVLPYWPSHISRALHRGKQWGMRA